MQQKILNNRYELEHKIGEGGMARVYRGRDLRLNRLVAIKVLHSHYASDQAFLNRFEHEAQAAANLRHPNIVDVYDVGQDGDIPYIVMEYVDGQDLKSILMQHGPMPVDQAIDIAASVAEGLEAAHRAGLIHRDIKPQNIIVGSNGAVKITDFGIAKSKMSTAMTETGVTFGTADYLSPEQARGQPATPASDVYSLGVTLYEMLTGRLPFTGDSSIAVAMQHVSEEPPPPRMHNPRIPSQLENLVLVALSKDPAARPRSALDFARRLRNYLAADDQPTVVRPAQRPPQRQVPRNDPGVPRAAPRTSYIGSEKSTGRVVLPPRPVAPAAAPEGRGLGFGGFMLSLLLLAGVLGIVYLFSSGMLNDLFDPVQSGGPQRTTPIVGGFATNTPAPNVTPSATATPTTTPTPTVTPVPQVAVPNVVGLSDGDAAQLIQDVGLTPFRLPGQNSDSVPSGLVIDQLPRAGELISETNNVSYVLSLGPALIEVPNVTNVRIANAQALVEQRGFVVQVRQEASASVSEGFVTRQEPFAGARQQPGDTVVLYVSVGNKVRMPDVTGQNVEDARRIIAAAGLAIEYIDEQGPDKIPNYDQLAPGTVVSHQPRGGEWVERGSGVVLGVRR